MKEPPRPLGFIQLTLSDGAPVSVTVGDIIDVEPATYLSSSCSLITVSSEAPGTREDRYYVEESSEVIAEKCQAEKPGFVPLWLQHGR
jgi:hypothetical protein